ncbi:MAG TPA: hypothetical protein VH396_17310 [Chitinophagaceae bacterium]
MDGSYRINVGNIVLQKRNKQTAHSVSVSLVLFEENTETNTDTAWSYC